MSVKSIDKQIERTYFFTKGLRKEEEQQWKSTYLHPNL